MTTANTTVTIPTTNFNMAVRLAKTEGLPPNHPFFNVLQEEGEIRRVEIKVFQGLTMKVRRLFLPADW